MTLFDDAAVTVVIADYIGIDAGGKANAIGLGFTVTGVQPTGVTPPQYVAVFIDAPARNREGARAERRSGGASRYAISEVREALGSGRSARR